VWYPNLLLSITRTLFILDVLFYVKCPPVLEKDHAVDLRILPV